jgi:hypothetical protein
MADDDAAKRAWIERVLGYSMPTPADAGFAKARERWQRAQAQMSADLATFSAALLGDARVKQDPRIAFVRAAVAEIPRMLPASERRIDALLAGGEAVEDVIAAVSDCRQALDVALGLVRLETFAARRLGVTLVIRAKLAAAMAEIETTLRAVA